MTSKLIRLRKFLATHYSLAELRTLCFDIGIPYEELGEEKISVKTLELILLLGRQRRLDILLREINESRPGLLAQQGITNSPEILEALYTLLPTLIPMDTTSSKSVRQVTNPNRPIDVKESIIYFIDPRHHNTVKFLLPYLSSSELQQVNILLEALDQFPIEDHYFNFLVSSVFQLVILQVFMYYRDRYENITHPKVSGWKTIQDTFSGEVRNQEKRKLAIVITPVVIKYEYRVQQGLMSFIKEAWLKLLNHVGELS